MIRMCILLSPLLPPHSLTFSPLCLSLSLSVPLLPLPSLSICPSLPSFLSHSLSPPNTTSLLLSSFSTSLSHPPNPLLSSQLRTPTHTHTSLCQPCCFVTVFGAIVVGCVNGHTRMAVLCHVRFNGQHQFSMCSTTASYGNREPV